MRLYHRSPAATAILTNGFADRGSSFGTDIWLEGVWLADRPLAEEVNVHGELLQVDIPEHAITDYEWVEEGKPYREWLVPARIVNRFPLTKIADELVPQTPD